MMNIKPLADRVLIEPAPAETKTIGGIIIPDTAKEKPLQGTIVAVGKAKNISSCVRATWLRFWDNQKSCFLLKNK